MTITFKVTQHFGITTSYKPNADLTAGQLLALDNSGKVGPCGTSDTNCFGIAAEDITAHPVSGYRRNVTVYQGVVEATLKTEGAVTAGATIEPGTTGLIDDTSATATVEDIGIAHEGATGAGEWILCTVNLPKFA